MDDDLDRMSPAELFAEVKKLRDGIRAHRNGDPFALAFLAADRLPDPADLLWRNFCGGCLPAAPQHPRTASGDSRPIVSLRHRRRA